MRFLKWKYGLETPPPETMPKTIEDVKQEDTLIAKAKAGKLVQKVSPEAPAKGPGIRAFNVFVGEEYYKVEVEPVGGAISITAPQTPVQPPTPAVAAAPAPASTPPPPPPPAATRPEPPPAPKKEGATAKQASAGAGETPLRAPIPGTIIRYLVKEGDEIKEGNAVVILEAMKMENEIVAPVSGKIKAINFKAGDKVPGDAVLAIIG